MKFLDPLQVSGKLDILVVNNRMSRSQVEDTVRAGLRLIAESLNGSAVVNSSEFTVGPGELFEVEEHDDGLRRPEA